MQLTLKGYCNRETRLGIIWNLFLAAPLERTFKKTYWYYYHLFRAVEEEVFLHHLQLKGLDDRQMKAMLVDEAPKLTFFGRRIIYYSLYEAHVVLISYTGALAIYKRDDQELGSIKHYQVHKPVFLKRNYKNQDVFGRKESS